jgi:hypothetical protein
VGGRLTHILESAVPGAMPRAPEGGVSQAMRADFA